MERQRKIRTFAQKTMRFGNQELQHYFRIEDQFYFDSRSKLDHIQHCLIDNI